jgi:hypothetical protein
MRAHAKATAEMVAANAEKVVVMRDQAALQLFPIPDDSAMSDMAKKYMQLRCKEELTKVKRRIQQTKADFICGLPGVVEPSAQPCAVPPTVSLDGPQSVAGAGGASTRNCSEGASRLTTMSTRESSKVAPFLV